MNLDQIITQIQESYAIDGIVKRKGESWAVINDDELTFRINYCPNSETHCVSVDNKKCFNKDSQCPVHFVIDLSRRKKDRLNQALKYLRTKEGERASSTFNWNGWDEFGHHVRDEFYRNSY